MQTTKALIIREIALLLICTMLLVLARGQDTVEAADQAQAILSQMQAVSSSSTGIQLVQAASSESASWKGRTRAGLRSRAIVLNPQLYSEKLLTKGTTLVTRLFDDLEIKSNVVQSLRNTNGVTVTTAKIVGSQWGRVFIASSNGQVRAKILTPEQGKIFSIEYNQENGLQYALELNPQLLQVDEDDAVLPPQEALLNGEENISQMMNNLPVEQLVEEDESTDATTVVDIMVVYSNDALAYAGSVDEINNIIALGMAMANDVHNNTETGLFLNLVHTEQVNYIGSGDLSTDLNRLYETSDGYMDEVHTLRDTYGADFVSLMNGTASSGMAGMAYTLNSSNGNAAIAFSAIKASAFDSYTPAHEIGHNMGLDHAKDQNSYPGPNDWYRDDYNFGDSSAGWHWHPVAGEKGYSSIMAYSDGKYYADGLSHTQVGLFSDPNINYEGLPCGHRDDGYNALVLRSLKKVYAAYRDRPIDANSIIVDSPNGSENWTAGSTQHIQWDSNGVTGNVKIELLNNGTLDQLITASTLNDRVYSWLLPTDVSGKNYTVRISNLDGTIADTSNTAFTIKSVIKEDSMETDPGYTIESDWEFGIPYGDNVTYGGAASAYTGTNVYDTNLDGGMYATGYLTSTAFDCSEYEDVQLSFMGWFSVYTDYAATVEVSTDKISWQSIFSISGPSASSAWKEYTFDISNYADEQATVYVRWGHIDTTGTASSNYSGMSVDDVKMIGVKKVANLPSPTTSIVPVLMLLLN